MPTINIGTRAATIKDRTYKLGQTVLVTMHAKHRPGKYQPHYGEKESAKMAARVNPTEVI